MSVTCQAVRGVAREEWERPLISLPRDGLVKLRNDEVSHQEASALIQPVQTIKSSSVRRQRQQAASWLRINLNALCLVWRKPTGCDRDGLRVQAPAVTFESESPHSFQAKYVGKALCCGCTGGTYIRRLPGAKRYNDMCANGGLVRLLKSQPRSHREQIGLDAGLDLDEGMWNGGVFQSTPFRNDQMVVEATAFEIVLNQEAVLEKNQLQPG